MYRIVVANKSNFTKKIVPIFSALSVFVGMTLLGILIAWADKGPSPQNWSAAQSHIEDRHFYNDGESRWWFNNGTTYSTVQSLGQDAYDNGTAKQENTDWVYNYDTGSDKGDYMKVDCQDNPVDPPEVDVSNVTKVRLVTKSNGDVKSCYPVYP